MGHVLTELVLVAAADRVCFRHLQTWWPTMVLWLTVSSTPRNHVHHGVQVAVRADNVLQLPAIDPFTYDRDCVRI